MANNITVRVLGDIKDLQSKLGSIEGETKRTADAIEKQSEGFKHLGAAVGGAFAVDKIIGFGSELVEVGKTAELFGKKASAVFEDQVGDMRKWADANNEAMGVTDAQLLGMSANMADLLKPMGFTAKQAGDMSKQMMGLSGALSAWSGGTKSAAEVSEILSSAMLGETDSLKGLGISLSAADIDAKLAANGQSELTGKALEQARALAIQQLILEKSTDAQKAWSDGTFDSTKKANDLKARMDEMRETLGEKLLPIVQGATAFIVDKFIPGLASLGKWVGDNKELLIALGVGIVATLVPAFIAWAVSAGSAAVATVAAAAPVIALGAVIAALAAGVIYAYQHFDWFRKTVDTVASFFSKTVWPIFQEIGGWFTGSLIPGIKDAISWVGDFANTIRTRLGDIGDFFKEVAGLIVLPYKIAFNAIATAWNNTAGRLSFKTPDWIPGLGGKGFDMPNLPTIALAQGGIVTAPTLSLIGEAGPEAVIPLSGRRARGLGGGSPTINVYALSANPRDISDAVAEALRDYVQRNGPLGGVA